MGAGGSILVVEDDPDLRVTLLELLREEGYPVIGAANGWQALYHLKAVPAPCLILLDLMMPVMSGWELRSRQQHDPTVPDIPVVVLSCAMNLEQQEGFLNAAAYLEKPFKVEQLLATVRRHYPLPPGPSDANEQPVTLDSLAALARGWAWAPKLATS